MHACSYIRVQEAAATFPSLSRPRSSKKASTPALPFAPILFGGGGVGVQVSQSAAVVRLSKSIRVHDSQLPTRVIVVWFALPVVRLRRDDSWPVFKRPRQATKKSPPPPPFNHASSTLVPGNIGRFPAVRRLPFVVHASVFACNDHPPHQQKKNVDDSRHALGFVFGGGAYVRRC